MGHPHGIPQGEKSQWCVGARSNQSTRAHCEILGIFASLLLTNQPCNGPWGQSGETGGGGVLLPQAKGMHASPPQPCLAQTFLVPCYPLTRTLPCEEWGGGGGELNNGKDT